KQIADVKNSARDQGTRFEEIVRIYLLHEPDYKTQYKSVVLWKDWNKRTTGDTGIDLVAEMRDGSGFVAVQCKCYSEDYKIQKPDIDSFLAASSKKEFVRRILVATTDLGKNAENAVQNQNPPVHVIGLSDLENGQIDWDEYFHNNKIRLKPKKTLHPHQVEAVEKVLEGFQTADRGQLIMACGTGKTFTSLKIAERLAGKSGLVLFLVPSLSLMSQTLHEWLSESEIPLHCYAVCSDEKVGKHEENDPLQPDDLAIPATTNAKILADNFNKTQNIRSDKLTVVFSTYQSIDVISVAQKKGVSEFDLVICDEAHRTTGSAQLEESQFVRVHNSKFIVAKKRLYMTATPRLYAAETKRKAADEQITVWSMDDPKYYGETFYYLGFSQAVEQDLLSDYKVIILGVDENIVSPSFQAAIQPQSNKRELPLVDPAKIVGCWNALAGKIKDRNLPNLKRAVVFTTSIKQSEQFQLQFQTIVDEYLKNAPDDSKTLQCKIEHVDGTMNSLLRNRKLQWLKDKPAKKECRLLSNARCLSEGVDVPALDAVMFLTPRKSKVDIVQSVGRVMRKADGKDYGYIILPVVIRSGDKPDEFLDKNETYAVVWEVLQALRAHDDRFQNVINIMELDQTNPEKIIVDFIGRETGTSVSKTSFEDEIRQQEFTFSFDDIKTWKTGMYGMISSKCGEKRYWEDWAKDVAEIAQKHCEQLRYLVDTDEHKNEFHAFLYHLQENINDNVNEDEAIEMLAQHKITKPVFDALFGGSEFSHHNPVSQALDRVINLLGDVESDTSSLAGFYAGVQRRVKGVQTAAGKQRIILELYDKFFKAAFPKMSERLGIVYTPIEVVDFILHSIDSILRTEFGGGFDAKNNDILDPFTGTGTFIVRLLQSGLIQRKNLRYEYEHEIHANEIVLLAYYIAAINIENTFHEVIGEKSGKYTAFPGIVLTDTFQMSEGTQKEFIETFPINSTRAKKQKDKKITVILGNPPYSAGQKSENDNNKNLKYPKLDKRISETYAEASTATLKKNLYDSYIRAIRWASDRIGDKGVIGFVSNGSYIDSNSMDGLRKCLADEFTDIYVFNCRGNLPIQRMTREMAKKEGGNIFGSSSRSLIAITIFVKNPNKKSEGCKIHYYDIGDYLDHETKLEKLKELKSIENVDWQLITPNDKHDWINQRNDEFDSLFLLGDKSGNETTIFDVFSTGIVTARDAWCYNFSEKKLTKNMKRMIDFYNEQREAYQEHKEIWKTDAKSVDEFIGNDPTKISWDVNTKRDVKNNVIHSFHKNCVVQVMYRPFCKQRMYFNSAFNARPGKNSKIFPNSDAENIVICIEAPGAKKDFTTSVIKTLCDFHLFETSQCFPYYVYETVDNTDKSLFHKNNKSGMTRRENITDAALQKFREHYKNNTITKWDIFYYVYGVLNSREYCGRFSSELK
ncbi:MAG: DEAD/DEAH box helicase family protein, partial [Planctomycetaceae bacterium]|nr:DEAD/DEAH box helicase family protein [Planctomycetaceae bacterium]